MDLYEKVSKLNDLTDEMKEKVELYRNDQHSAKIKPE